MRANAHHRPLMSSRVVGFLFLFPLILEDLIDFMKAMAVAWRLSLSSREASETLDFRFFTEPDLLSVGRATSATGRTFIMNVLTGSVW